MHILHFQTFPRDITVKSVFHWGWIHIGSCVAVKTQAFLFILMRVVCFGCSGVGRNLCRKSWIRLCFWRNIAWRHVALANHIGWRSDYDWSHSGVWHNVSCLFTELGIVHHFKTHLWMLPITVGLACLICCGRGSTEDHKQSWTGQLQDKLFIMDKYHRENTTDISLCGVKFYFHYGAVLFPQS